MHAAPKIGWIRWRGLRRALFLAGFALLGALIWHFGWRTLYADLREARPGPLLLFAALTLAGFWIRAWKWRCALGPGRQAWWIFFFAKMGGNWSPGRIGEFSPLLLRRHRTPVMAGWIVLDRMLEIAATLLAALAGAAWISLLPLPAVAALLALGAAVNVAVLWLIMRKRPLPPWIRRHIPPGTRRARIARHAGRLREAGPELSGRLPAAVAITALAKAIDLYAVVALCAAFGYGVGPALAGAARGAHALVSAIPLTPDATGAPFVAAAVLLHEYGGMPYATLTVALALEAALINGILWVSFGAAHLRRGPAPPPASGHKQ